MGAVALAVICCTCWGRAISALTGASLPRPVVFLAGAAVFSHLVLVMGLAGFANRAAFLALAAASIAIGFVLTPPPAPVEPRQRWLWIALAPFAIVYLVHAMAPEISPDGMAYHVSIQQHYLRQGAIVFVPENLYAQLSQGLEMLFLFVLSMGDRSAAALMHQVFLAALVALIWQYGRSVTTALGAFTACVLVACSPVIGIDAASAYTDVATAAVVLGSFVLLRRWERAPSMGLVAVAGLLAGYAYSIKYTAFLAVPLGVGFVLWKGRRWRPAVWFAAAVALMILPWMVKNYAFAGNPVAPFFNAWFPNAVFDAALEGDYLKSLRWYPGLASFWSIPWELAGGGFVLNGMLGPVWLLAPLALFSLRRAECRWLMLAALLFGLPWATNIGTRFLIPALPFLAIAWAMVFERRRWVLALVCVAHALLSWPWVASSYAHRYAWRIQEFPWAAAWRIEPEAAVLKRKLREYPMAELLSRAVKPGERVLTQSQFTDALTTAEMVTGPLSRPGVEMRRMLYITSVPRLRPLGRIRFWFMTRRYQALRLRQVAGATGSVAEIQLYHLLTPVDRTGAWRFTAKANPWMAAGAFDGSTLTRWMGEWLEVRFPAPVEVDRIDMIYHPLPPEPEFVLEGQDEAGVWRLVSDRGEVAPAPERAEDLPANAARILLGNGVRYLLLRDRDYHPDLGGLTPARNMAGWPVRLVGEFYDMHLYRIEGSAQR